MEIREPGHLGIPKIKLTQSFEINPLSSAAWRIYHPYLSTADGRALLERLRGDERVAGLADAGISNGGGATRFDIDALALWWAWLANSSGIRRADECLEAWLDAEQVETIATLWVLGLDSNESFEITEGYWLTKLDDLPDSNDKATYWALQGNVPTTAPLPRCAITKRQKINKVWRLEPSGGGLAQDWSDLQRSLYDLAHVLNAVTGVLCVPYYQTSYNPPESPLGMFGGSGGGYPLYDVATHNVGKIGRGVCQTAAELFRAFKEKPENERGRLNLILGRLSQAKRRVHVEDALLDLGIALEMLLLDENKQAQQLALMFKLRGSWLLGTSASDRHQRWKLLSEIYDARSSVAHTGTLHDGKPQHLQRSRQRLPAYIGLAEEVVRKVILEGSPDWRSLVLGGEPDSDMLSPNAPIGNS
ncbi:MAG: hypothetical protein IBJ14_04265 [Hydrogenophaga sp.]|nr:hypothetical protein [Hydrogenophaga sp.]